MKFADDSANLITTDNLPVFLSMGVGEGSVLEPFIFLMHVYEVYLGIDKEFLKWSDKIKLRIMKFADDCTNLITTDDEWEVYYTNAYLFQVVPLLLHHFKLTNKLKSLKVAK